MVLFNLIVKLQILSRKSQNVPNKSKLKSKLHNNFSFLDTMKCYEYSTEYLDKDIKYPKIKENIDVPVASHGSTNIFHRTAWACQLGAKNLVMG